MSVRIAIDNNFFDSLKSNGAQESVLQAFANQRLSFYPTPQLLTELFSLYQTRRKDLLRLFSAICLKMMNYRFFNEWGRILRSELGILREGTFLPIEDVQKIRNILERFSAEQFDVDLDVALNEVIEEARKSKDEQYRMFKDNQRHHFALFKANNIEVPAMSFEDFFSQAFALQIRKDTLRDILVRGQVSAEESRIDQIVDNPRSYPYFYTTSRVFTALFYRHVVLGRRVDEGDSYDQHLLVYLTKLDYMVSDDLGLKELAEDVFGTKGKVISFDEFVAKEVVSR